MKKHWIAFSIIACLGAVCDIVTKYIAFHFIPLYQSHEVIPGALSFKTLFNSGIIFGVGKDLKWAGIAFLSISLLAVPVILYLFRTIRRPRWILTLALGLILAGTCGNMYDRLLTILGWHGFQGVRDFIYVSLIEWPIFNLADSFICTGVFLLTLDILFAKEPTDAPAPAAPEDQGTPNDPSRQASPSSPSADAFPRPSGQGGQNSGESDGPIR